MPNKTTCIIDQPRKLVIPDESGRGNHIEMLLNWNRRIKDCEYIKLVMPDKSESIIQKDKFRSIMFLIANQEERQSMGRQRITTVRTIRKDYKLKAKKDIFIKEGEEFIIPIQIQVPVSNQDEFVEQEGFLAR